ncbi:glycosyltransferase, partial [Paramuribaculum intestinale]
MSGRSTIFSIITVSYNAVGDIERTVRSVMEQDFRDFEYLIIDGASKDGTPKKAAEITGRYDDINVTIISEPDSGIYDAMNKGLDRAVGEYLIFLNAGDAFHDTDTLSVLSRAIESNNLPGIVYGQTDIVDKDGNRL